MLKLDLTVQDFAKYSSTRPSNKLEDDFYVDVASGDHHEDEILTSKEKEAPSNNETAPSNSMTNNGTESPLCKGKWVKIAETKVCAETPSLKSTLSSKTRRLG
ncbi:unnamed protein product [Allacma fusca]|uniref:Uncharacterized protein n=1 Tax=Allacma fusca TaxID=39272 RepID=A0A8J2L188_9HEXA|nr:unnamed protein product [Allacma fusca]